VRADRPSEIREGDLLRTARGAFGYRAIVAKPAHTDRATNTPSWHPRSGNSSRGEAMVSGSDGLAATRRLLEEAGQRCSSRRSVALEIDERRGDAEYVELALASGWTRIEI